MKMPSFPQGGAYRLLLVIASCSSFFVSAGRADVIDQPQNATELLPEKNPVLQLPPEPEKAVQYPVPVEPSALAPQLTAPPPVAAPPPGKVNIPGVSRPAPVVLPDEPMPSRPAPRIESLPHVETLYETARRLKLPLPLPAGRIVIFKAQRRLELWNGSTLVKTYRMALGDKPNGRKQRKYDGRTPEGEYYICTRNASTSHFHIFLGLSYPALHDAKRGVQSRAISWREYEIIRQRLASRSTPLWTTDLGGWVGIHGGTNNIYAQRLIRKRGSTDWTAGCIAVTDSEIEELHAATRLGTPVLVKP